MADMNKLQSKWQTRAGAASNDLVEAYTSKTGKLDAARSDAAEASYAAGVQNAIAKKRRQKALAKVSEEDMNRGMREKGGANYATSIGASGDKWAQKAAPFIAAAEDEARKLPARTANPVQNVTNRVVPIVKRLSEMRDK